MILIRIRKNLLDLVAESNIVNWNPDLIGYNLSFIEKNDHVSAYFLPGTKVDTVFFLGADYIFNYSFKGELIELLPQHKSLMPVKRVKNQDANTIYHSHLDNFSPFITATDICQIKLYSKMIVSCTDHEVVSSMFLSKYNADNDSIKIVKRIGF